MNVLLKEINFENSPAKQLALYLFKTLKHRNYFILSLKNAVVRFSAIF